MWYEKEAPKARINRRSFMTGPMRQYGTNIDLKRRGPTV
jgi:hypothetical protein